MCVSVCVCLCVCVFTRLHVPLSVCARLRARYCTLACVCSCACTYTYIHMSLYACTCARACLWFVIKFLLKKVGGGGISSFTEMKDTVEEKLVTTDRHKEQKESGFQRGVSPVFHALSA